MRRCVSTLALLALLASACAKKKPAAVHEAPTLEAAPSLYATLDGLRVHYKLVGHGHATPIVFVHGWTCDMSSWTKQVPFFAESGRVVALDLPRHGGSDKPEIPYTMDLFARAVSAVMAEAKIPKAVLVGHSMGTPVVRQVYRREPGKVVGLAAVDGSLKPFFTDPAAIERFLEPFRGPDFRQAQLRMLDTMFHGDAGGTKEAVGSVMLATPQHVVVSAAQGMFDPAVWKDDKINVPLLCVLAKSPFWNDEYEAYVRRLASRLDYRVLDEVGHFLMLEKPDHFNTVLSLFVTHPPYPR